MAARNFGKLLRSSCDKLRQPLASSPISCRVVDTCRYQVNLKSAFSSIASHEPLSLVPPSTPNNYLIAKRFKKKRTPRNSKDEEEEDDEDDDDLSNENPLLMEDLAESDEGEAKVSTIDVGSLRLDAFGKVALNVTRAKVEEAFYKGELYLNGERPAKKSVDISKGDEIDLILRVNPEDHNKIDVRRAQIVKMPDKTNEQGRMKVVVKRWISLTIDAYDSGKS